jgi:hypothetical protein
MSINAVSIDVGCIQACNAQNTHGTTKSTTALRLISIGFVLNIYICEYQNAGGKCCEANGRSLVVGKPQSLTLRGTSARKVRTQINWYPIAIASFLNCQRRRSLKGVETFQPEGLESTVKSTRIVYFET